MSELVDKLLNRLTDPMNFGARLCDVASMEELLTLRTDYYALKIELQVAHNGRNHYVESQMVELFVSNRDMEGLRLHDTVLWARLHSRPRTKTDFGYKFNVQKEFYRVVVDKLLKLDMGV